VFADARQLIAEVYRPERYFGRLRRVAHALDCTGYRPAIPLRRDIYEIIRLSWRCLVADAEMRREVWRTVVDCARHNPAALRSALRITALYIQLGPFARHAVAALERKTLVISRRRSTNVLSKAPSTHQPPWAMTP
jgi:hypothetical protein